MRASIFICSSLEISLALVCSFAILLSVPIRGNLRIYWSNNPLASSLNEVRPVKSFVVILKFRLLFSLILCLVVLLLWPEVSSLLWWFKVWIWLKVSICTFVFLSFTSFDKSRKIFSLSEDVPECLRNARWNALVNGNVTFWADSHTAKEKKGHKAGDFCFISYSWRNVHIWCTCIHFSHYLQLLI